MMMIQPPPLFVGPAMSSFPPIGAAFPPHPPMPVEITPEIKQDLSLPPIKKSNKHVVVLAQTPSTDRPDDNKTAAFDLEGLLGAEVPAIDSQTAETYFPIDRETASDKGIATANSGCTVWHKCMTPQTLFSGKTGYYEASRSVRRFMTPCPLASDMTLGAVEHLVRMEFVAPPGTILEDLFAPGGGLKINMPWSALKKKLPLFRETKDSKTSNVCVYHMTDAVLEGYDASSLRQDFRLTLHSGAREMSSANLGKNTQTIHNWETSGFQRGLLIAAGVNTFEHKSSTADQSAGMSMSTSNKAHLAWHHRLIGLDYRTVYAQIGQLSPAENYHVDMGLVTVNLNSLATANPQHNRDFLAWMVAHFWPALFHMTIYHIKDWNEGRSEKFPVSVPDGSASSAFVVVHQVALQQLLDVLYSLSGQRNVVNLCEGLQLQLQVCGGEELASKMRNGLAALLKDGVRDARDQQFEEMQLKSPLRFRVRFAFREIRFVRGDNKFQLLLSNDNFKEYQGRRHKTKEALKAKGIKTGKGYLMGGPFMG
jgi:hypothetical protein